MEAAEVSPESYDTLYGALFAPAPDAGDPLADLSDLTDLVGRVFGGDDPLADEARHLEDALHAAAAHEWTLRAAAPR
ncbi:hypothetical protein [Streptomyces sp. NPDC051997]|uniref:hypothetical protein n=1 Tax=Streptomyces sp. NPDC051997 TaxID=3155611 RepID=UPI0034471554